MRYLWCLLCFVMTVSFANTLSQRADVQKFINQLVTQDQFNREKLTQLLDNTPLNPRVIPSMQRPSEAKPWYVYEKNFVNNARIKQGVGFWHEHDALLQAIQTRFHVDADIIVATAGIETNYGQVKGSLNVLSTLTTLAFDYPARGPFFQNELREYLLFTREHHLNPRTIKGSYAGAMGFGQFMPSSYRAYGVTFSGNARADLVNHLPDALASIANYYHKSGWQQGKPVIVLAAVREGTNYYPYQAEHGAHFTLAELKKAGITPRTGHYAETDTASLITLKTSDTTEEVYIAFKNFYVIKRYNPSNHYAMAVAELGDRIQQQLS